MRDLMLFEAAEDGGGPLPVEADGAAEPDATAEGGEPSSLEAAPSTWTGPSPDEWEELQARSAQMEAYIASLAQGADEDEPVYQDEDGTLDPFADDFGTRMERLIEGVVSRSLSPLTERHAAQEMEEAESKVQDVLADIAARDGDFNQPLARHLAEGLLPSVRARYGPGPRAADAAIHQAAKMVRELEATAKAKGVEEYKNRMGTIAGADREAGIGIGAVQGRAAASDEEALMKDLLNLV